MHHRQPHQHTRHNQRYQPIYTSIRHQHNNIMPLPSQRIMRHPSHAPQPQQQPSPWTVVEDKAVKTFTTEQQSPSIRLGTASSRRTTTNTTHSREQPAKPNRRWEIQTNSIRERSSIQTSPPDCTTSCCIRITATSFSGCSTAEHGRFLTRIVSGCGMQQVLLSR